MDVSHVKSPTLVSEANFYKLKFLWFGGGWEAILYTNIEVNT